MRRHTIVGCSKSFNVTNLGDSKSLPGSRPDSRQRVEAPSVSLPPQPPVVEIDASRNVSADIVDSGVANQDKCQETIWTNSLDELQWKETLNATDKLSLTLDEIIHIRSVMTKAELEGLPVGIKIKEEVERRKLCFLCLRTRFSLFGQRGVNCKLCDRTVCIKCFTKVRLLYALTFVNCYFTLIFSCTRCEFHANISGMCLLCFFPPQYSAVPQFPTLLLRYIMPKVAALVSKNHSPEHSWNVYFGLRWTAR